MQRNQRFSANALKARGDFIILQLWVKESERLNGALGNAIKHSFWNMHMLRGLKIH